MRAGRPWPRWPEHDDSTRRAVLRALDAGRWTLSWPTTGEPSLERRFAEQFAAYHGAPYAVCVDHGSSALVVALEALDVGPGDEVVVPAMTWVATASAVLRVGAVPVLVDVDPETGCLSTQAVAEALSDATKAVIVVHLACAVADLDGLVKLTRGAGLSLIEDCAQAHGARWRGRPVGTFGVLGAFSFQSGKLLAAGEGGAVVCADAGLYLRLQQLRADSRRYADPPLRPGSMELVEEGGVMGANYGMPELIAAVLIDQLTRFDAQHARRELRACELESALEQVRGLRGLRLAPHVERRAIFEYAIRFEPGTFADASVDAVAAGLSAELERPVYPPDVPLPRSVLFRPRTKRRFAGTWDGRRQARLEGACPGAEAYRASTLLLHHSAFLGDSRDVTDIVGALVKVLDHATELPHAVS